MVEVETSGNEFLSDRGKAQIRAAMSDILRYPPNSPMPRKRTTRTTSEAEGGRSRSLRRRGRARAAAPSDPLIAVVFRGNLQKAQEASAERDRNPLPPDLARNVLDRGLPWGGGFHSRPQRLRGRKLRHDGTPSRPAGADEQERLLPGGKSVSQTEARGTLNSAGTGIALGRILLRRPRAAHPVRVESSVDPGSAASSGEGDRRSGACPEAPSTGAHRLAAFRRFSTTRQSTLARKASMYSSRFAP